MQDIRRRSENNPMIDWYMFRETLLSYFMPVLERVGGKNSFPRLRSIISD
jgi:hypothetical protein